MRYDRKPKLKKVIEPEYVNVEVPVFMNFDEIQGAVANIEKANNTIEALEVFSITGGRLSFDEAFSESNEIVYDEALAIIKDANISIALVEDMNSDDKEVAVMAFDDVVDAIFATDNIVIKPWVLYYDALNPAFAKDEPLTKDDFDMDEVYKSISEARKAIKKKEHKGDWTIKEVMSTAKGGVRKLYKTIHEKGKKKKLSSKQKHVVDRMQTKAHNSKAEQKRQRSKDAS